MLTIMEISKVITAMDELGHINQDLVGDQDEIRIMAAEIYNYLHVQSRKR